MIVLYIASCAGILSVVMAMVNAVYISTMILGDKVYLKFLIACIIGNISVTVYLVLPFFGLAHVAEPFDYMIFVAGSAVAQIMGIPIGVILAVTWKFISGLHIRLTRR